MKNSMIPTSELKILGEIFEKTKGLMENHNLNPLTPSVVDKASDIEQIHIVMYMDLLKEMIQGIYTIKDLLEIDEEEYIKALTDDGKKSLKEVKRTMMMKMLTDILMG